MDTETPRHPDQPAPPPGHQPRPDGWPVRLCHLCHRDTGAYPARDARHTTLGACMRPSFPELMFCRPMRIAYTTRSTMSPGNTSVGSSSPYTTRICRDTRC